MRKGFVIATVSLAILANACGNEGPAGQPGKDGRDGETGMDGEPGMDGAPGMEGTDGEDGSEGMDGEDGMDGQPGLEGEACWDVTGDGLCNLVDEDVNDDAACDYLDCQGPEGTPGMAGPQGPQGDPGPPGATGPQGPQGDPGATGPQGPQGNPGATGPQGDPGATGPQGPEGPQGPQGNPGPTSVASCPAGAQTVSFTHSTLCVFEDVIPGTWNDAQSKCYNNHDGASLCSHEQLRRACNSGTPAFAITFDRWLRDRVGDDLAVVTNSTDCNNFDASRSTLTGTAGGRYCCLEWMSY